MSRPLIWSSVVLLSVIVLFAAWFMTAFERYDVEQRVGYSLEARRDPLLGATRMLRQMGVETRELQPTEWREVLSQDGGTLVVMSDGWTLGNAQLEALMDWVERGGHLVVASAGARLWDIDDEEEDAEALLEYLDLSRAYRSEPSRDAVEFTVRTRFGARRIQFRDVTRIIGSQAYAVLAADDFGACVLQRPMHRGLVTALCDASAFRNQAIGELDHATVLWWLASRGQRAEPLWFVRDTDMPPLYAWLWQRIPEALVAGALALLAWLWARTARSGPHRNLGPPARRRTIEHIEASGRFTWHHDGAEALLGAMRREFSTDLERLHPGWARLERPERLARLARASGLSAQDAYRAIEGEPHDRRGFVEAVRNLQLLRKSL